jgi:hypothetical protein
MGNRDSDKGLDSKEVTENCINGIQDEVFWALRKGLKGGLRVVKIDF